MKDVKLWTPLRHQPIARFYYKGKHTHPVRRTVVLIETNRKWFRGYELREGSKLRNFRTAPIKTYRKNKIANMTQLDSRSPKRSDVSTTTLVRANYVDLIVNGA
jgi:hypothetical protein